MTSTEDLTRIPELDEETRADRPDRHGNTKKHPVLKWAGALGVSFLAGVTGGILANSHFVTDPQQRHAQEMQRDAQEIEGALLKLDDQGVTNLLGVPRIKNGKMIAYMSSDPSDPAIGCNAEFNVITEADGLEALSVTATDNISHKPLGPATIVNGPESDNSMVSKLQAQYDMPRHGGC